MPWPPTTHADVEAAVNSTRRVLIRNALPVVTAPGCYAESFSRWHTSAAGNAPVSGQPRLTAMAMAEGEVVTSLTFLTGGAGSAGMTRHWAALSDVSGTVLAVSSDLGSTVWAGSTPRTFTMTSPFAITTDGLYYIVLNVVATTPPQMVSIGGNGPLMTTLQPTMGATAPTNTGAPPTAGVSLGTLTGAAHMQYAAVA